MKVVMSMNRSGKAAPPPVQLRWTEIAPGDFEMLDYDVFLLAKIPTPLPYEALISMEEYFQYCQNGEVFALLCAPLSLPVDPESPDDPAPDAPASPKFFYEAIRFVGSVAGISAPFTNAEGQRCCSICLDAMMRTGCPAPMKFTSGRKIWNARILDADLDNDVFQLVPSLDAFQPTVNSKTVVPATWTWHADTRLMTYALGASVEGYDTSYDLRTEVLSVYEIGINTSESLSCDFTTWPLNVRETTSTERYYQVEVGMNAPVALVKRNEQSQPKTVWVCLAQSPGGGMRYADVHLWRTEDGPSFGNTEFGIVTLYLIGPRQLDRMP